MNTKINSYFLRNNVDDTQKTVQRHAVDSNENLEKPGFSDEFGIYFDENEIINNGFRLVEVVKKLDNTFAGMVTNTYFICILITTGAIYSSTSIFLGEFRTSRLLFSASMLSVACLCITRLIWITSFGQNLSNTMKECGYHLDRFKFYNKKIDEKEIELLRQDVKYHSESPIKPFSCFGLSNNTLLGAFGTIITYLIVLLQFKVSEMSMNPMDVKNMTLI